MVEAGEVARVVALHVLAALLLAVPRFADDTERGTRVSMPCENRAKQITHHWPVKMEEEAALDVGEGASDVEESAVVDGAALVEGSALVEGAELVVGAA